MTVTVEGKGSKTVTLSTDLTNLAGLVGELNL